MVSTRGIHSSLSANSFEVTHDTGLSFDERQVYAERTQTVVFRGSLQQLFAKFRFGEATQVPDIGQTRMYCAGPRSIRQIDGTDALPHWEASVAWTGLHSYIHGPAEYIWRVTPLWTEQETHFPVKYDNLLGSDYTLRAGFPYVPTDADFGADHACVIHDHVPGYQVEGVMLSSVAPYPSHPHILAILATLGIPNSADMVDYGTATNVDIVQVQFDRGRNGVVEIEKQNVWTT